ncbi:amino acid ABC transporter ATP-binding protein [Psychrilyobacter atlanticus]|uniref:amino acid ABC transporter ATP-binding protein n=1 Tax=Psychrilyobacter atlanticus TaxID=271091 RepID=UPI00040B50F4|nr:amino acid ABC transporter ATP-binding protein [Psychrilyobacter atlanticus]
MSIKIKNINKSFGNLNILKDISLDINKGEVLSIIGPSGSGKSTLLRCLIDLEEIDSGTLEVFNDPLVCSSRNPKKKERFEILKKMGMVFQSFNLFPHKTAIENVMEPLIVVDKIKKEVALKKAAELLTMVGLEDRMNNYPSALSGGQQQRVAIARVLARNPKILLFDEPTSALDPEMVKEVLTVIESLKNTGITMIIVSHEMEFVKQVSDRVVFMDYGTVLGCDTPDKIFNSARNERINKFLNNF